MMKIIGLFIFILTLSTSTTMASDSDILRLRGRVPASVDYIAIEDLARADIDEDDIRLNVSKTKYRIEIKKENHIKLVNIIFH